MVRRKRPKGRKKFQCCPYLCGLFMGYGFKVYKTALCSRVARTILATAW